LFLPLPSCPFNSDSINGINLLIRSAPLWCNHFLKDSPLNIALGTRPSTHEPFWRIVHIYIITRSSQ
jgi:hypothetical protein